MLNSTSTRTRFVFSNLENSIFPWVENILDQVSTSFGPFLFLLKYFSFLPRDPFSYVFWTNRSILSTNFFLKLIVLFSGATRGVNRVSPPPPHLTPAWSWLWAVAHLFQILSIKKKMPKSFFGTSCIISNLISNYFLVFDFKKVSHS